jgi:hypothetical protein
MNGCQVTVTFELLQTGFNPHIKLPNALGMMVTQLT